MLRNMSNNNSETGSTVFKEILSHVMLFTELSIVRTVLKTQSHTNIFIKNKFE